MTNYCSLSLGSFDVIFGVVIVYKAELHICDRINGVFTAEKELVHSVLPLVS